MIPLLIRKKVIFFFHKQRGAVMESILTEKKQYNKERQILNSENDVIDRLFKRPVEMKPVYDELAGKLSKHQQETFWDAILAAAVHWNPESSKKLRDDRRALINLNKKIEKYASKLAECIRERKDISEISGLSSYEDYHVIHWVDRAAENNYMYQNYVQKELHVLRGRFDLKYWPNTHEVIDAIASFAVESEVYVTDDWTEELLSSPKCSMMNYLSVVLIAIEDRKKMEPNPYRLSCNFRVTDNSLATHINCTLDLEPDDMISAEYVKSTRQNIREAKKNNT